MIVIDVEGAVERNGEYLMIVRGQAESHAPGALSFPGGKVEPTDGPDNALESALRREVREETGVEVHPTVTYVESGLFDMDDGRKALAVVFLCHYRAGSPSPGSEEVESVQWMTPDEIRRDRRANPWLRASVLAAERTRQQSH